MKTINVNIEKLCDPIMIDSFRGKRFVMLYNHYITRKALINLMKLIKESE